MMRTVSPPTRNSPGLATSGEIVCTPWRLFCLKNRYNIVKTIEGRTKNDLTARPRLRETSELPRQPRGHRRAGTYLMLPIVVYTSHYNRVDDLFYTIPTA